MVKMVKKWSKNGQKMVKNGQKMVEKWLINGRKWSKNGQKSEILTTWCMNAPQRTTVKRKRFTDEISEPSDLDEEDDEQEAFADLDSEDEYNPEEVAKNLSEEESDENPKNDAKNDK